MAGGPFAVYRSAQKHVQPLSRNRVWCVAGFLSWWDGAELWLSGLGFVLQTVIVMPVVLALAYGIAMGLDAILGNGIAVVRRLRRNNGPR